MRTHKASTFKKLLAVTLCTTFLASPGFSQTTTIQMNMAGGYVVGRVNAGQESYVNKTNPSRNTPSISDVISQLRASPKVEAYRAACDVLRASDLEVLSKSRETSQKFSELSVGQQVAAYLNVFNFKTLENPFAFKGENIGSASKLRKMWQTVTRNDVETVPVTVTMSLRGKEIICEFEAYRQGTNYTELNLEKCSHDKIIIQENSRQGAESLATGHGFSIPNTLRLNTGVAIGYYQMVSAEAVKPQLKLTDREFSNIYNVQKQMGCQF